MVEIRMMKIIIETIPHDKQRYDTVGDWIIHPNGNVHIYVSNMKNWKYEFLVAFHELSEMMLCRDRGIPQSIVDDFDKEFESRRETNDNSEPGDHPLSPYKNEHFFATTIERLMAAELNVDWSVYDKEVTNL
jgi:hypothetical protein